MALLKYVRYVKHKQTESGIVFKLPTTVSALSSEELKEVTLLGTCPTTTGILRPNFFLTATAYGSAVLSSSLSHDSVSPTNGVHMSLYTW